MKLKETAIWTRKYAGSILAKTIKKIDLFPRNIMLTYKGDTEFATVFGGLVSAAILAIVGVYFGYLIQDMVTRSRSNNTKSTKYEDLTINDENYYPVNYWI